MKTNMTYHARVERADRLEYILNTTGIGEVVAEAPNDERGGLRRLTNTGVIIVVAEDHKTVVTAFICDIRQARSVYAYSHNGRLPNYLANRVYSNSVYQKKQP